MKFRFHNRWGDLYPGYVSVIGFDFDVNRDSGRLSAAVWMSLLNFEIRVSTRYY